MSEDGDGNSASPMSEAGQLTPGEEGIKPLKAEDVISADVVESVESVEVVECPIEQVVEIRTKVERRFVEFHETKGQGCWRCLIKQYCGQLDAHECEQLSQEASGLLWAYVSKNPEDGNRIENWWAFYMTIANRLAVKEIKRKRTEREACKVYLQKRRMEMSQGDAIRQINQGERDQALQDAVRGLPPHYRRAMDRYFQLKRAGRQPLYEILAAELNVTVPALRGILQRAMALIRLHLES